MPSPAPSELAVSRHHRAQGSGGKTIVVFDAECQTFEPRHGFTQDSRHVFRIRMVFGIVNDETDQGRADATRDTRVVVDAFQRQTARADLELNSLACGAAGQSIEPILAKSVQGQIVAYL
jgi:hypothetical protein